MTIVGDGGSSEAFREYSIHWLLAALGADHRGSGLPALADCSTTLAVDLTAPSRPLRLPSDGGEPAGTAARAIHSQSQSCR